MLSEWREKCLKKHIQCESSPFYHHRLSNKIIICRCMGHIFEVDVLLEQKHPSTHYMWTLVERPPVIVLHFSTVRSFSSHSSKKWLSNEITYYGWRNTICFSICTCGAVNTRANLPYNQKQTILLRFWYSSKLIRAPWPCSSVIDCNLKGQFTQKYPIIYLSQKTHFRLFV